MVIDIGNIYKSKENWDYLYVIAKWSYELGYSEGCYLCLNLSKEVDRDTFYKISLCRIVETNFNIKNTYSLPYRVEVADEAIMEPIDSPRATRHLMCQVLRTRVEFPTLFE